MKRKFFLLGICICAIIVAARIYSYPTKSTTTNNFVFKESNKVRGELKEPEWDGVDFGEKLKSDDPRYDPLDTEYDKNLGLNQSKSVFPGMEIPKNPAIKNTSYSTIWAAMKINFQMGVYDSTIDTYTLEPCSYTKLRGMFKEFVFGTNWMVTFDDVNNCAYAWYNKKVPAGKLTQELIQKIVVRDDMTDTASKPFSIVINGYVVQEGDFEDCKSAMYAVFSSQGFPE